MPLSVAPEMAATYELVSPSGYRVTFNGDPTDPDFGGQLTDHSGFDSPEIREEQTNKPADDGGINGIFLFGRRPMTLTGQFVNATSMIDRTTRLGKVEQAVLDCLKTDGVLSWTLSNGIRLTCKVRANQPPRVTGAWSKQFQIALVADDPRFYNSYQQSVSLNRSASLAGANLGGSSTIITDNTYAGYLAPFPLTFPNSWVANPSLTAATTPYPPVTNFSYFRFRCTNNGNAPTYPLIRIQAQQLGIIGAPGFVVRNSTTGKSLWVSPTGVAAYGTGYTPVNIDMKNKLITGNDASIYQWVIPNYSDWFSLVPGDNVVELITGYLSSINDAPTYTDSAMTVSWQDAWI